MSDLLFQLLEWLVNGFGLGGKRFPRHVLYFSVGWGGIASLRLIRALLRSRHLPTMDSAGIAFGGGRYSLGSDDLLLGGHGEGGGGIAREGRRLIRVGGGSGGMDIGCLLLETERARLYALGTVGGIGAGINAQPTFRRRRRRSDASGGYTGVLLHGGLGFECRVPLRRSLGLAFGVRVGWVQPILTIRFPQRGLDLPRLGSPRIQGYTGLSSDRA